MASRRTRKKTETSSSSEPSTPSSKSEMPSQEISIRDISTLPPLNLTFIARTSDAFHFKATAGLLCDNIKIGCFKLSSSGFGLKGMNTSGSLFIKIFMKSSSFNRFEYSSPSPKVTIGLNIPHFNKMLKSIKKKDTLQLNIDGDSELKIRTSPQNNSRITTSILKIQRVQQVRISEPIGPYGNPVIISSPEFNKTIKDLNNIGTLIRTYFTTGYIRFECGDGNVLKRTVEFGDVELASRDLHMQEYDTEQLGRICKISGMNSQMQIYTAPDMPILIKSFIGTTGDAYISLYIKDNKMISSSTTSQ